MYLITILDLYSPHIHLVYELYQMIWIDMGIFDVVNPDAIVIHEPRLEFILLPPISRGV